MKVTVFRVNRINGKREPLPDTFTCDRSELEHRRKEIAKREGFSPSDIEFYYTEGDPANVKKSEKTLDK